MSLPEKVEICGMISDGHHAICLAVATVFSGMAHQRYHDHSFREAAKPIDEADRHARKERKQRIRGSRPMEQSLQGAIAHVLTATASSGPHLFFCSQIPDLPRTNHALEQSFGSVRRSERRATGRRGVVPGLVVHGAVRIQAALAPRVRTFTADDVVPHDLHVWRTVRAEMSSHHESRCTHSRFRNDPSASVAHVEHRLFSYYVYGSNFFLSLRGYR